MRNVDCDRVLFLATEQVVSPTRLARGHSRRLGFDLNLRYSSTFLRPFAPSPLRDFRRFIHEKGRMYELAIKYARLVEKEEDLLGASFHLIGIARRFAELKKRASGLRPGQREPVQH